MADDPKQDAPQPPQPTGSGRIAEPSQDLAQGRGPSSSRHARIEFVSNAYDTGTGSDKRSAARTSSAMWEPLKASSSAATRISQMLLPSGWGLLMAAVMLAWRLLTVAARGELGRATQQELVLGVLTDVALTQSMMLFLRLMSAVASKKVEPTADVTRSGSLMLACVWVAATLLRLAGLVAGAIDKKPIDASFWLPIVQSPSAWLTSGAMWTALVAALATAFLARYSMTCDMETAQALSDAEPRPKFLAMTTVGLLASISVVAAVGHQTASLPPTSVAQLPEAVAMQALSQALHDPTLRQTED